MVQDREFKSVESDNTIMRIPIKIGIFLTSCLFFISTLHAAEPISIGAVLPLSGKFATFGNKALQGIELAIEKYNATDKGKKRAVRLLIKDSQGLPESAEKAVIELDKEGVDIIIGPILGATAESAAKKAQELGIPIITMTQKEGIAGMGEWVFRNSITNSSQVKGLVKYAGKAGIKKVAVLYPDNTYGRELSTVFDVEMAKMGGEVVAAKSYRDGQTDFGSEIKAMVGPDFLKKMKAYTEGREKRFKGAERSGIDKDQKNNLIKPRPGFDAIFIADYSERVGLIVPQLAFFDVTGIKLLGISGWNSPKLIEMASDFLNNALFVDGFFPGSRSPQVKDFVNAYMKTFGEEPGILEAQAYDSTGIVLSVIAGGASSREAVKDGINKIKEYQGVSGDITFKERDAERSFYYLTVNKGVIEEIIEP